MAVKTLTDYEIALVELNKMIYGCNDGHDLNTLRIIEKIIRENKEELDMAVKSLKDEEIALLKKSSNQNQQWIPCSEKMPKDCGFYLVSCIDNDGWEHVKICSFHKQVVDEFSFFDAFSDTVAWQEIPKPYNKEELDVKYVVTNCEDCMHESICGVKEQFREALTECPAANGPFKIELRCEFFRKEQPTRKGGISYVKNNG